MSSSVSEFFSKGEIKKFKSGLKNFAERNAQKAVVATMVLASVFAGPSIAQASTPQDRTTAQTEYVVTQQGDTICSYQILPCGSSGASQIKDLVNNATQSDVACSVLKGMSACGTAVTMDRISGNQIGFFDPNSNSVVLNELYSNDHLQSILIHEAKHAIQDAAYPVAPTHQYDFFSNIMRTRVMEADAMATQVKFSYEMKQAGDASAWDKMQEDHSGMTEAFEEGVKTFGKDSPETMKQTMLAWYDDKGYTEQYDDHIADYHKKVVGTYPNNLHQMFNRQHNADSLITKYCVLDSVAYAGSDGSLLNTPRTAYMSKYIYNAITRLNKNTSDKSVGYFYQKDKTYFEQNAQKEAEKAAKTAEKEAKKQKKSRKPAFDVALNQSKRGR